MKHQKHIKLTRKENDIYAPKEIAILGANCTIISKLVENVSNILHDRYRIAYIDSSHSKEIVRPVFDTFTFHSEGNLEIQKSVDLNVYNERVRFNAYDLSFINGNHYEGKKQIIILDTEKENSIIKRLDQINDILFFVAIDENSFVFDCLKEKFDDFKSIPIYNLNAIKEISKNIDLLFHKKKSIIDGLILVGGKSSRMGTDKSTLDYYGKSHSLYLADLLKDKMVDTYLSVRDSKEYSYPVIKDRFIDLGPFGAICSAFLKNPNKAYFVLATDLPFINEELIDLLIENRDSTKIATTVKGLTKEFPEPLITIWEPKAYPTLLSYLAQGISCPRKVLINSDVKIIEVADKLITNVNTFEDFKRIRNAI
tara:strand:+ start:4298 stop:5401 length:1104 start_codon:yes stop_codon:yes gene_type:complete